MYILKIEIKNNFDKVISTQYFVEMMSEVMTHISQEKTEAKPFNTENEAQAMIENNKIHLKDFIIESVDTKTEQINEELQARIKRFEERRQSKIDRLKERAEKIRKKHEGNDLSLYSEEKSGIPLGQPILVGHHSERRHRRHLERIERKVRAHFEANNYADNLENRAQSAESNDSIMANDPLAQNKIAEKIKKLEKHRDFMKAANKLIKKEDREALKAMFLKDGYSEEKAEKNTNDLFTPNCFGRLGFESFSLTNTGAEIRRLQKRLTAQTRIETGFESFKIGEILVELVDGQIQVEFQGKPSDECRASLKKSPLVLKWSGYSKRWVRKYTDSIGKYFFNELKAVLEKENNLTGGN
jgi:hypothetical protein